MEAAEFSKGQDRIGVGAGLALAEKPLHGDSIWTLRKYADEEAYKRGETMEEPSVFTGNVFLKEGINVLLDLMIGETAQAWDESNAFLGVGDDNTAADDDQTGLLAATNKVYVAMESGYPQRTNQTVTFRGVFGSGVGNFDWREFTVSTTNSNSGVNLNRLVSSQGTKASGQIWTLDMTATLT